MLSLSSRHFSWDIALGIMKEYSDAKWKGPGDDCQAWLQWLSPTLGSGLQCKTFPGWWWGGCLGDPDNQKGQCSGAVGPGLCRGLSCMLVRRLGVALPHMISDPTGHPDPWYRIRIQLKSHRPVEGTIAPSPKMQLLHNDKCSKENPVQPWRSESQLDERLSPSKSDLVLSHPSVWENNRCAMLGGSMRRKQVGHAWWPGAVESQQVWGKFRRASLAGLHLGSRLWEEEEAKVFLFSPLSSTLQFVLCGIMCCVETRFKVHRFFFCGIMENMKIVS